MASIKQRWTRWFKALRTANFWINIGLILASFLLVVWLFTLYLASYTHHGEALTVPDFNNLSVKQVEQLCEEKGLRFEIKDSIFASGKPALAVVNQNPKAGATVKSNRKIYITINRDKAPMVKLPQREDIINVQVKSAQSILENAGFVRGDISYEVDIAENAVLKLKYNGKEIEPGTKLPMGSTIDLVLGDGGKGSPAIVPNLIGVPLSVVKFTLGGNELNLGTISIKDGKAIDSAKAYVVSQSPSADTKIAKGSTVNITVKQD